MSGGSNLNSLRSIKDVAAQVVAFAGVDDKIEKVAAELEEEENLKYNTDPQGLIIALKTQDKRAEVFVLYVLINPNYTSPHLKISQTASQPT